MTKRFKIIIRLIGAALGFYFLANFYLDKNRPKEIQQLIEKTKTNKEIIGIIGGYDSYQISYNYALRDLQADYPFEVTLFGNDAYINFKGVMHYVKRDDSWVINKNDTIVKKY